MDILGIDIGGSGIKGALVDPASGELSSDRRRIPTPAGARPADVARVVAELQSHFEHQGPIGITFPGIVQGAHPQRGQRGQSLDRGRGPGPL
ncbi:ROK family protein [Deinococcus lacus]|uniref:ROK family protein n=1 Tax=Deinococcus lacus TaxID=392561 RepID=A0ABW1YE05_9DEIO